MPTTRVTWTALPNATGDQGVRLSVFAALRLGDPTPAGDRLDGYGVLTDWPAALDGLRFHVVTDAGHEVAAAPDPDTAARADSTAWTALFPPTSPVRPFAYVDHSLRGLRTLPAREVLAYAQNLYTQVTQAAGTELPALDSGPLKDLVDDLGFIRPRISGRDQSDALAGAVEEARKMSEPGSRRRPLVQPPEDRATPTAAFMQAARFYARPENAVPTTYDPPHVADVTRPRPPEFDVHSALAALADSPSLLRVFGLVIDLVLDEVPRGKHLRLVPVWPQGEPPEELLEVTPWTAYQHEPFLPAPREDSDIADGWLQLEEADDDLRADNVRRRRFDVVPVDADGTALKLLHLADTGRRILTGTGTRAAAYDTPRDAGLPALQSSGLALVRHARALTVAEGLLESAAREELPPVPAQAAGATPASNEIVLYADDLVRGYRVDVQDGEESPWRSLCSRTASWSVERPDATTDIGTPGRRWQEEGYVKAASTTSADAEDSDLYLGETVARWSGWSLVAPRPGRTVVAEPGARARDEAEESAGEATLPTQEEHVAVPERRLDPSFPLVQDIAAALGSLPVLRYGHEYRLRARVVDLAGNSVTLDDDSSQRATRPVTYRRFEPVPPPTLVPRAEFREGASLERMVIRSDRGVSAADYAQAHPAAAGQAPLLPVDERHVVPPKAAELTVETSGMLDAHLAQGGDPRAAYDLAVREAHTLHERVTVDPSDIDRIVRQPLPGVVMVPGRDPLGTAPGDRPVAGGYLIIPADKPVIAYLPDPAAAGAALHLVAPEAGQQPTYHLPWRHDPQQPWHEPTPALLRIVEPGPGAVANDDPRWGPVVVLLPQAELLTVRYSSLPDTERILRESGIWAWAQQDELYGDLREGRLWPITPFRSLTLVHAVQRPLHDPLFESVTPQRTVGETAVRLRADVRLDVKSTGTLDVDARWDDWVDDPMTGAVQQPGRAHVAQLDVDRAIAPPGPAPQPAGFPLTAHGPVRDLVATRGIPLVVQEFGDTKHRVVTYRLRGTTPFREYFPPSVAQDVEQISTTWTAHEGIHVPSTARPAAPKPLYAVPTWRWEPAEPPAPGWTQVTRTRQGGGIRVWMDRPWWSSGEGELLGIVLREGRAQDVPDHLVPYVTRIGRDPFWDVPAPRTALRPGDFVDLDPANGVRQDLTLAEMGDLPQATATDRTVSVAAVPAQFDSDERKLWFADLELPGAANTSYMPFLRLALARFQPWSVPGTELSRVVTVDPIQLLPDRRLQLHRTKDGVDVTLSGPGPEGPYRNGVSVTLEVHDGRTPGELGWTTVDASADRPNPVWLSDSPPSSGWKLPPGVLDVLKSRGIRVPATRTPLDLQARAHDVLLAADAPLAAAVSADRRPVPVPGLMVVQRPGAEAPAVGRFLTARQLDELRSQAGGGGAATQPVSELAPVVATAVAAESAPMVAAPDLGRYGIDLEDLPTAGMPAFALQGWQTWQGHLPLPPDDGRSYRLLVQEHEYAETDESLSLPFLTAFPSVQLLGSRVVYADAVRL